MLTRLLSWTATKIDQTIGWSRLPTVLAVPALIGLREHLRAKNFFDSGRGAGSCAGEQDTADHRAARTLTGPYNNDTNH